MELVRANRSNRGRLVSAINLSSIPGSANKALQLSRHFVRGNPQIPYKVYLVQVVPMSGGRYLLIGCFHQTGSVNATVVLFIVNGSGIILSLKYLNEVQGDGVFSGTAFVSQPVADVQRNGVGSDLIFIGGRDVTGLYSQGTLIGAAGFGAVDETKSGPKLYSCKEDWSENTFFVVPYITGAANYIQQVFSPTNEEQYALLTLVLGAGGGLFLTGTRVYTTGFNSYGNTSLTEPGVIVGLDGTLANQSPSGEYGIVCRDSSTGWFVYGPSATLDHVSDVGGLIESWAGSSTVGVIQVNNTAITGPSFSIAMQGSSVIQLGNLQYLNATYFSTIGILRSEQYGVFRRNNSTGLNETGDSTFNNLAASAVTTSFTNVGFSGGAPKCLAVDPSSGQIYLGGNYSSGAVSYITGGVSPVTNSVGQLVCLNNDGTFAWTLSVTGTTLGIGVLAGIYCIYAFSGGAVVVGNFTTIGGVDRDNFAVINSSGTVL